MEFERTWEQLYSVYLAGKFYQILFVSTQIGILKFNADECDSSGLAQENIKSFISLHSENDLIDRNRIRSVNTDLPAVRVGSTME